MAKKRVKKQDPIDLSKLPHPQEDPRKEGPQPTQEQIDSMLKQSVWPKTNSDTENS